MLAWSPFTHLHRVHLLNQEPLAIWIERVIVGHFGIIPCSKAAPLQSCRVWPFGVLTSCSQGSWKSPRDLLHMASLFEERELLDLVSGLMTLRGGWKKAYQAKREIVFSQRNVQRWNTVGGFSSHVSFCQQTPFQGQSFVKLGWEINLYLDIRTSEDGCTDSSPLFLFKGHLLARRIKSLSTARIVKLMLNANKRASINEIDHTDLAQWSARRQIYGQELMVESAPQQDAMFGFGPMHKWASVIKRGHHEHLVISLIPAKPGHDTSGTSGALLLISLSWGEPDAACASIPTSSGCSRAEGLGGGVGVDGREGWGVREGVTGADPDSEVDWDGGLLTSDWSNLNTSKSAMSKSCPAP